jgi:hypothetical protein
MVDKYYRKSCPKTTTNKSSIVVTEVAEPAYLRPHIKDTIYFLHTMHQIPCNVSSLYHKEQKRKMLVSLSFSFVQRTSQRGSSAAYRGHL